MFLPGSGHFPGASKSCVRGCHREKYVSERTAWRTRVSAGIALMDRAYGKAPAFSTTNVGEFRKAIELSDDELIRIAAEAGLKIEPVTPSTVAQTAPEPKLEPAASEHLAPGALRTSTH